VASRGKTLKNRRMMTVNSEVWFWNGQGWDRPCSIRPSLLMAGAAKDLHASKLWEEYSRTPWFRDAGQWVTRKLKANLPVSMGGLGTVPEFDWVAVGKAVVSRDVERGWRKVWVKPPRWWTPETVPLPREDTSVVMVTGSREERAVAQDLLYSCDLPKWRDPVDAVALEEALSFQEWSVFRATEGEKAHWYQLWKEGMDLQKRGLFVFKTNNTHAALSDLEKVQYRSMMVSAGGSRRSEVPCWEGSELLPEVFSGARILGSDGVSGPLTFVDPSRFSRKFWGT